MFGQGLQILKQFLPEKKPHSTNRTTFKYFQDVSFINGIIRVLHVEKAILCYFWKLDQDVVLPEKMSHIAFSASYL